MLRSHFNLDLVDPIPFVVRRHVPYVKPQADVDADAFFEAEFAELRAQRAASKKLSAPCGAPVPAPAGPWAYQKAAQKAMSAELGSLARFTQAIGRGIRAVEHKAEAVVLSRAPWLPAAGDHESLKPVACPEWFWKDGNPPSDGLYITRYRPGTPMANEAVYERRFKDGRWMFAGRDNKDALSMDTSACVQWRA